MSAASTAAMAAAIAAMNTNHSPPDPNEGLPPYLWGYAFFLFVAALCYALKYFGVDHELVAFIFNISKFAVAALTVLFVLLFAFALFLAAFEIFRESLTLLFKWIFRLRTKKHVGRKSGGLLRKRAASKPNDGEVGGMKFRKKPVIIEAKPWFVNGDHPAVKAKSGSTMTVCKICGDYINNHGEIETLEGAFIVCSGDWIIKGVHGEFYACKPDIFWKTYEPID